MLPSGAIFEIKIHQGAFAVAPAPTGGAYNAPPDPIAGFQGPLCENGGEGGKGKGEEGRAGKDIKGRRGGVRDVAGSRRNGLKTH